MKKLQVRATAALAALLGLATAASAQQQITTPRLSPNASVTQMVGITEITLHYSRPGVKGRKIWGELVPYGEVWRTGANENTTIRFSTPVKIGGKELPAGLYGLQTIPTADEWTVIFSKDADQWGAFSYKPENDALRIQAKPEAADFQERMGFEFDDLTDNSAKVVLRWEKLAVPFTVEVDTPKLVDRRGSRAPSAGRHRIRRPTGASRTTPAWTTPPAGSTPRSLSSRPSRTSGPRRRCSPRRTTTRAPWPGARRRWLPRSPRSRRRPAQQVADLEKLVGDWKKK